jgi:chromosome partitioning protein
MILSIANQKGGTGKTTTTLVLAYLLARRGKKVLAIDFDPQASLTMALKINPNEVSGVDRVLLNCIAKYKEQQSDLDFEDTISFDISVNDAIETVSFMDVEFDLIPANPELEDIETQLKSMVDGDSILLWSLGGCKKKYDIILIDNRPALDWLVVNALTASDYILAPVELSTIALGGFAELLKTVARVKRKFNENLKWLGILPVKFERRNKDMNEKLEILREKIGKHIEIFPPVPKSVSLERMLHINSADELMKNVKSAKNVLQAYENVVDKILEVAK